MRRAATSGKVFLVVANFHGTNTMEGVSIRIPQHALKWLDKTAGSIRFSDRLADQWQASVGVSELPEKSLSLPDLPPLSARMLEIR